MKRSQPDQVLPKYLMFVLPAKKKFSYFCEVDQAANISTSIWICCQRNFFNLKYVTSVICSPVLGIFTNSKIQHHFIHFFIGIFLFIYFYSLQQKIRCTIIILTIYFFQNCLKLQRGTIIYNYNKPRRQISEIITSRINVKPNAFCYGILTEMVVLWCFP